MTVDERFEEIDNILNACSQQMDTYEAVKTAAKLTSVLINICREQQTEIDNLKSDIEYLQRKVNRIKSDCLNEEW